MNSLSGRCARLLLATARQGSGLRCKACYQHLLIRSYSSEDDARKQPESAEGAGPSPAALGWMRGPEANKPNKSLEEEWVEVRDPSSGQVAWRSLLTGETTVPGAPKPDTWVEVVDKKTGLLYYWCKRTGETTALGEPKPGPYGRKAQFDLEAEGERGGLLEGGGEGRGAGARGGRVKDGAGGPSLMRLVSNPLVIGVSLMALAGIAYENVFK